MAETDTVTVPVTLAPVAGLVKPTVGPVVVFCTVTDRLAVAVPPLESVTEAASACAPTATPLVFQA